MRPCPWKPRPTSFVQTYYRYPQGDISIPICGASCDSCSLPWIGHTHITFAPFVIVTWAGAWHWGCLRSIKSARVGVQTWTPIQRAFSTSFTQGFVTVHQVLVIFLFLIHSFNLRGPSRALASHVVAEAAFWLQGAGSLPKDGGWYLLQDFKWQTGRLVFVPEWVQVLEAIVVGLW
jgi:hypothetical protein